MPKKNKSSMVAVAGPYPVYIFKRGVTWFVYYSRDNKKKKKSLGTKDKSIAMHKAKRLSIELATGEDQALTNKVAIAPLLEKYFEYYSVKNKASSLKMAKMYFKRILELYPVENISEITLASFETYMIKRIKSGTATGTVNNSLVYFKTFLNWAEDREYIKVNPIRKLRKFKGDPKKESRYISQFELSAIIKASSEYHGNLWRLYANTGLRRCELLNLERRDIDLARGFIKVRRELAKNNTARFIPIAACLKKFLKRAVLKSKPGEPLFLNEGRSFTEGAVRYHFNKAVRLAGIKEPGKVHIQSLRVTFGTNLDSSGSSFKSTMALLGHKTPDVTLVNYLRVRDEDLKASIQGLPQAK